MVKVPENISAMFADNNQPSPPTESIRKAGKTLMMGGAVVEEVGRYLENQNPISGLSRAHGERQDAC